MIAFFFVWGLYLYGDEYWGITSKKYSSTPYWRLVITELWDMFRGISRDGSKLTLRTPWYLREFCSTGMRNGQFTTIVNKRKLFLFLIRTGITVALVCAGLPVVVGANFTSKANGLWDAAGATTWNEANFPGTGDTATLGSTHVVTIQGTEACGNITVGATATLTFDGQADGTPAIMNLDNGATLSNSNVVNQTGTGSTGYAGINGVSAEPFTGTQPALGGGYWKFGQIDFTMNIATGGGTCVFEFVDDCSLLIITVTLNDTLKCVTDNVTITGGGEIENYGTILFNATSGNEIIVNKGIDNRKFIDLQYVDVTAAAGALTLRAASTIIQADNCTFTGTAARGVALATGAVGYIFTNCTFVGTEVGWGDSDIVIYTGCNAVLDTCTFTTVGMNATSGWLVAKDGSSNFTIYGILASSETPSAGYRAADITGDLTISQASAYGTPFNSSYTLGANCLNVNAVTVDDSTTLAIATFELQPSGNFIVGGGASGAATVDTGTFDLGGTTLINSGATLGTTNKAYTIDFGGDLLASAGTFIAPNSSGDLRIRGGITWNEPSTFTHSSGEATFLGSATVTINTTCLFSDVDIANFCTVAAGTNDMTMNKLDIGGGVSGVFTVGVCTIKVDGDFNIGTGASFGTAATAYTLDHGGNMLSSNGTLIAPNAGGTYTFAGTTWRTPGTFTHSGGVLTFDKGGTTTLGNNSTQFGSITINGGATLDTHSGNNYNLTASALTSITGTLTCNASTISLGSGGVGANYALTVAGIFNGGSGTHTIDSLNGNSPGNTITFTSGICTISGANTGNNLTFALHIGTTWDDGNGTIIFTRAGDQLIHTGSAPGVPLTVYNLTLNKGSGLVQFFNSRGGHLTVDNNLTITAGELDTSETGGTSRDLTVTNDISIAGGGTLTGNASTITCTGDISNAGTYTANTSTFVMDGATQSLTGSWTFWHFTKSVGAADTLTFEDGETYTFGGNVTINGAAGQLLSLVSSTPTTQWFFTMSAGSVKTDLSFLSVTDSDASASDDTPIAPSNSTDGGNNIDWFAGPSGSAFQGFKSNNWRGFY